MKDQKRKKRRRRYDAEFKKNALDLIGDGRSVRSVAHSLGISEGVLHKWKQQAKEKSQMGENEDNEEIIRLKKELQEVKRERDILKKALSIFSRST